jgi:homeodomain-containing protein
MGRQQIHGVALTVEEREFIIKNTKSGDWSPREVKRALILLKADKNSESKKDQEIADELHCCQYTVTKLRERFAMQRLKAIHDKPRTGRPRIIDGDVEAHIVAVACSEAPEGREHWTLRLIAGKVVSLTDVESCSYSSVRNVLKKTNLNRGKRKNGKSLPKPTMNLSGGWKKS